MCSLVKLSEPLDLSNLWTLSIKSGQHYCLFWPRTAKATTNFTFSFMHLANTLIQNNLNCIQFYVFFSFFFLGLWFNYDLTKMQSDQSQFGLSFQVGFFIIIEKGCLPSTLALGFYMRERSKGTVRCSITVLCDGSHNLHTTCAVLECERKTLRKDRW